MAQPSATHFTACIVCGPTARCDRASIEGTITRVTRHEHNGPRGRFSGVHLHLHTAEGPYLLLLGERFGYLADGLNGRHDGVVVRAYHLRRGRERSLNGTAQLSSGLQYVLTDAESVVVLEPDWLLDVTALKGTEYCLRQWLTDRLAARAGNLQIARGTVVHGCFQRMCRDGTVPLAAARELIDRATLELALLGRSKDDLLEAVAPHLERLAEWRALYGAELFTDDDVPVFESTLLCPELGLRGRVDLVLRRQEGAGGPPLVSRVVELKTGKYNEEWPDPEFQVRGYYAILASQQRLAPSFRAQVIYTGSPVVQYRHVPCGPEHIQAVVTGRNRAVLALLLGHAPPASGSNRCRKSSGRAECVRLSALLGLDHCQGRDLADAAAGEPDPRDIQFYATQHRLLRLEERATSRALASLWRETASAREEAGTAIMVLAEEHVSRAENGRYRYRLRCRNRSELRAGDTVLLSDGEPVRGEVTVAALVTANSDVVEVEAMEPIACPCLIDRYATSEAQDRTMRGLHAWLRGSEDVRALLYTERRPEVAPPVTGSDHQRCSVWSDEPSPRGSMAFVTEPVAPQMQDKLLGDALVGKGMARAEERLNPPQAMALDLALRVRDYLLVQGPPGTGKTFLIARIVRELTARGDRVAITAWTNQAVDTLLHALLAQGCTDFVRLGSARHMDPLLASYALVPAVASQEPVDLARRLRDTLIVAGTVSALADARLTTEHMCRDVLVLDEAAQLGVAAATGALRLARRFILVGDDQQLPPVVQSEEAAHDGLSLSPFALLRPEAQAAGLLVQLTEQYRMHAAIAAWPSEAFYDGTLVAHPSVAARQLPVASGPILSPVTARETPLVLVDAGWHAAHEIELAARAANSLMRSGVPATQIGIVAPFRASVSALRRALEHEPRLAGCMVDTVDRFQGGQREAMVVCLGLDGIGRRGHAFVDDPRRLNVAFTRARSKLIVVGDLTRAAGLPTLAGFLHHCREREMPRIDARQGQPD